MRYSREQSEFDRAVGFIDATFALALTLLITSIDIPNRVKAFISDQARQFMEEGGGLSGHLGCTSTLPGSARGREHATPRPPQLPP